MNFLESVVAEWYMFKRYFVRTNVRYNLPVRKTSSKGGWDCELDVLAYKPATCELVHIETSSDANAWAQRRQRFLEKKFVLDVDDYKKIIESDVHTLRRIALVGYSNSTKQSLDWGEAIEARLIPDFFREIGVELQKLNPMKVAVPEGFPILRAMQFATAFCRDS